MLEISKSTQIMLARILPFAYLDDFLNGDIYMNSDIYFSAMDNDPVRKDIHEGIVQSRQIKQVSIRHKLGAYVPIEGVKSPLIFREYHKNVAKRNLLCMYMLVKHSDFHFDERNLSFGDKAVLIRNPKELLRRMKAAAILKGMRLSHSPVSYVDKSTYDGRMGIFRKFDHQSYQNEFRVVLYNPDQPHDDKHTTLEIGDIRDITTVMCTHELSKFSGELKIFNNQFRRW
ncbi:hypothetical protein MACH09_46210 [Vibrio sp. MACH09]|uniref:hypothetical protein n=1 Tax=Vibrio sp. MACH09 TaxID=3025122 RepID=UPI00278E395A|nr:hypothetical protein [Vibrio sp. MACH09]GLO64113.1 hypothetical protein MACH09_46210 [Vibrio sp. MACH09]